MEFLIDRCAGRRLAEWLSSLGHDVVEARSLGPDPGDSILLRWATEQKRILVTIDKLTSVNWCMLTGHAIVGLCGFLMFQHKSAFS